MPTQRLEEKRVEEPVGEGEREKEHMHKGEKERERKRFGFSFYIYIYIYIFFFFSSTWACPMQIGLSQECCFFYLKSSLWSSDLPVSFLVF